jgi:2'-5' RNA ligase
VVWVGCEALPPLELLQHRLEQEMERLGFAVEGRPFRPHVTLGRVEREARAAGLRGLGEALDGLNYAAQVTVGSLDLMQSELRRDGARYTVRRRVELAA